MNKILKHIKYNNQLTALHLLLSSLGMDFCIIFIFLETRFYSCEQKLANIFSKGQ